MKIEIWSDVMCPFCYIGKRKLEQALELTQTAVEIEWKSFQLNPALKTQPDKNSVQHLAESKGWSLDYAKQMTQQVTNMAREVGLEFNFEKAVVANSFDAHRLSHYAKTQNKQNELEELLFKAYFTDGKNTADHSILMDLGRSIDLNEQEMEDVLKSDKYTNEVKQDIFVASEIGVRGVPFFVFDQKFAISGAQPVEVFVEALQKSIEHQ